MNGPQKVQQTEVSRRKKSSSGSVECCRMRLNERDRYAHAHGINWCKTYVINKFEDRIVFREAGIIRNTWQARTDGCTRAHVAENTYYIQKINFETVDCSIQSSIGQWVLFSKVRRLLLESLSFVIKQTNHCFSYPFARRECVFIINLYLWLYHKNTCTSSCSKSEPE